MFLKQPYPSKLAQKRFISLKINNLDQQPYFLFNVFPHRQKKDYFT